jgi:hypothetical protein
MLAFLHGDFGVRVEHAIDVLTGRSDSLDLRSQQ